MPATALAQRLFPLAAALIIGDFPWSDTLGLVLAVIVVALNAARRSRARSAAA